MCAQSTCQPIQLAQSNNPALLAVDGSSVFWIDNSGGDATVMKVSVDGGTAETIWSGQGSLVTIAVDGTSVYWTTNQGALRKAPKGGGAAVDLAVLPGGAPDALSVDTTNVYGLTSGALVKVPIDGGPVTTLVSPVAPTATEVPVDNASVYWASLGGIMKVPIGGGTSSTVISIASTAEVPVAIAIDTTSVYWTEPMAAAVMKAPIGGGTATTLATGGKPAFMVADSHAVFWADVDAKALMRVSTAGGATKVMVPGVAFATPIAADAHSVYFTNGVVLMKVAK
jgi:hypothetical protein